jgi:type VI protein secretion system component VasF
MVARLDTPPPSLAELHEPLFQYICMLNRIARNPGGENVGYAALRKVIEDMLSAMEQQSNVDSRLAEQYQKTKLPLIFFIDSMIAESRLSLAPEWHRNRMAYEHNELAGDEKFFDFLDDTLRQNGKEADERLAFYYTCLGLGFSGWYSGQPEYLREKTLAVAQRVPRELIDTNQTAKVCPEAYLHLDTRNLVEPPGLKLATMGILVGGLMLVVLVMNIYLFRTASTGLGDSLRTIIAHDLSAPK